MNDMQTIKLLRVKTECERKDFIDDRQNTIRFFYRHDERSYDKTETDRTKLIE